MIGEEQEVTWNSVCVILGLQEDRNAQLLEVIQAINLRSLLGSVSQTAADERAPTR